MHDIDVVFKILLLTIICSIQRVIEIRILLVYVVPNFHGRHMHAFTKWRCGVYVSPLTAILTTKVV